MVNKFSIYFPLSNLTVTVDAIIDKKYLSYPNLSAFEKEVLLFCHLWCKGISSFEQNTSGSTGVPKSIQLPRKKMEISAQTTNAYFNISKDTTALLCISPSFIGGKMMLVRAMVAGCSLTAIPPDAKPYTALSYLDSPYFDFVALVPHQVNTCLKTEEGTLFLDNIKDCIIGGAPLSISASNALSARKGNYYTTYGMTETISHIALKNIKQTPHYIGIGDIEFAINEENCLMLKGAITDKEWLVTNDIVHLIDNTQFEWRGRFDFVINRGGVKLNPEQIESKITVGLTKEGFGDGIISKIEESQWGESPVLVLSSTHSNPNKEKLLQVLSVLSKYEMPLGYLFIESIPKTKNDKLDRQRILSLVEKEKDNIKQL